MPSWYMDHGIKLAGDLNSQVFTSPADAKDFIKQRATEAGYKVAIGGSRKKGKVVVYSS